QNADVLLHARERHVELPGKVRDRSIGSSELLQNATPRGVRERGERSIESGRHILNHMVQYNAGVRGMQGVAAKHDASDDLSRARASVTTTSLPNGRIVTALFAGALFLSAFLLFVLEPMVAKSILPTLGGTPMVWNTRLRGTEVVDLVEAEAARDDRFKWALGKIWIVAKGLPPDVVERIVIASGTAIRPA
ncbi:MAG TPA: hypothetical protein VHR41_01210, partial [Gemmatimonadales bacterium]|nr:hypothetical protein [Gemmatimonadales bacterium]